MKKEQNLPSKQTSTKTDFNSTERKILRLLYQSKVEMTAYEVAKELGITFPTAKKYLEKLTKQGVIIENAKEKNYSKNGEENL